MSAPEPVVIPSRHSWLREIPVSALLFLLLAEWFRPLPELASLTEIYMITPFLTAFACFLAMDLLRMPQWAAWPLKAALSLFFVGYMFSSFSVPHTGWYFYYIYRLTEDVHTAAGGNLTDLSAETRTLIFLVGWALMISVIQSLMLQRQHGLWFVAATLVYLAALKEWLGVDTSGGMMRTMLIGLLLQALLLLPRLERLYPAAGRTPRAGWPLPWCLASALLLIGCAAAGWYGTGREPSSSALSDGLLREWTELFGQPPAPAGGGVVPAASSTGYGEDDNRLGGPLKLDDRVVFTARTPVLTYWRGEAKSYYDGRGWRANSSPGGALQPVSASGRGKSLVQEITLAPGAPQGVLLAGGKIGKIADLATDTGAPLDPGSIRWDPVSRSYRIPAGESVGYYRLEVDPAATEDSGPASAALLSRDLQLPASLPERVRKLAASLTAGTSDPYQKALRIESYLKNNFAYSLDKPRFPGPGEDFVDQFLFAQKVGYCDHFSTAMVVLLRSAGVPARWVKGFAPGQASPASAGDGAGVPAAAEPAAGTAAGFLEAAESPDSAGIAPTADAEQTADSAASPDSGGTGASAAGEAGEPAGVPGAGLTLAAGEPVYNVTVRNRDAHSWVEVYLPPAGWVAFDPTPGFPDPPQPALASAQAAAAPLPAGDAPLAANAPLFAGRFPTAAGIAQTLRPALPWAAAAALLLAPAAALAWRHRTALAFAVAARGLRRSPRSAECLLRVFGRLWRRLYRRYGAKPPQMTLREYVAGLPVDERRREALVAFAREYEALRYGGARLASLPRRRLFGLWRAAARPGPAKPGRDFS